MRVATEATVAAGCVALVVFATGPIILLRSPHLTNLIYMATIISGGIAFAAISASVFGRSAICAAAIAAATTAGNAAAVPMLVAAANHDYAEAAAPATVLVASTVIVTAMLVPPLTAWWASRARRSTIAKQAREPAIQPVTAD